VTFFVFNRGKCFCGSSFIIAIAFWRRSSAIDLALFAENLEALSFLTVRCILLITAGRDGDGFKSDLTDALCTILLFLFPIGSKEGVVVVIVGAGTGLGTFAFPGKNKSWQKDFSVALGIDDCTCVEVDCSVASDPVAPERMYSFDRRRRGASSPFRFLRLLPLASVRGSDDCVLLMDKGVLFPESLFVRNR